MNQLKNRVQLIGRLGQDPEVKTLESGKVMARFSLATSETYKNPAGEKESDTQWHQIVVWGTLCKVVEAYFRKGKEVVVVGKLSYRTYEKPGGQKVYLTEIIARELLLIDKQEQAQKVA